MAGDALLGIQQSAPPSDEQFSFCLYRSFPPVGRLPACSFAIMTDDRAASLFEAVGIDTTNAKNVAKNAKVAPFLVELIEMSSLEEMVKHDKERAKQIAAFLMQIASRLSINARDQTKFFVQKIMDGDLRLQTQVEAALNYLNKRGNEPVSSPADLEQFKQECGIGITFSETELRDVVASVIKQHESALLEERYQFRTPALLSAVRNVGNFKWADFNVVRQLMDSQIETLLGPKTEADLNPVPKKETKKKKEEPQRKAAEATPAAADAATVAEDASLKPGSLKEYVGRELTTSRNTKDLIEAHEQAVGKKIVTRFPPEPNGYLHIGHTKAMNFSFTLASESETGGMTYLRFDDTNPEAEKTEYISSIQEDVAWMGFVPCAVTYSSDYFDRLLEIARDFIRRGIAYVDHQTPDEIKDYRERRAPSPWRDRPVEENVREFQRMCEGRYEEGAATLRLKMDHAHDNPNMRDLVAYRIKYTAHPKTGTKYCVYPSYDYTHCLCDSIENITHSLCSLEFEVRREPYFWILEMAHMWKPSVWEFSRLNISKTQLSKRKLNAMVTTRKVRGWDDPRLATIRGLRRRGYTAAILRELCNRVGVTRNDNMIHLELLEQVCRLHHDRHAERRFGVVEPIRVHITNLPADVEMEVPNHPKFVSEMGSRRVVLGRDIYIESSDFRAVDSPDYFGLALGKEVALRYAGINIRCDRVVSERELECSVVPEGQRKKVKGYLHWVNMVDAVSAEFRLYEPLFLDDDAEIFNEESEKISQGFVEKSARDLKVETVVQLERVGFFVVDKDSDASRLVFNRTVTLKESFAK